MGLLYNEDRVGHILFLVTTFRYERAAVGMHLRPTVALYGSFLVVFLLQHFPWKTWVIYRRPRLGNDILQRILSGQYTVANA